MIKNVCVRGQRFDILGLSLFIYGVRTHGIPRLKAQLDASDGMALQIADRHYTATARPRVVTVVLF